MKINPIKSPGRRLRRGSSPARRNRRNQRPARLGGFVRADGFVDEPVHQDARNASSETGNGFDVEHLVVDVVRHRSHLGHRARVARVVFRGGRVESRHEPDRSEPRPRRREPVSVTLGRRGRSHLGDPKRLRASRLAQPGSGCFGQKPARGGRACVANQATVARMALEPLRAPSVERPNPRDVRVVRGGEIRAGAPGTSSARGRPRRRAAWAIGGKKETSSKPSPARAKNVFFVVRIASPRPNRTMSPGRSNVWNKEHHRYQLLPSPSSEASSPVFRTIASTSRSRT